MSTKIVYQEENLNTVVDYFVKDFIPKHNTKIVGHEYFIMDKKILLKLTVETKDD